MKAIRNYWKKLTSIKKEDAERGSALAIVMLLLSLLTIYVSASLTVSTTDAISSNFEVGQRKGFYTAYAKLEQMTADFSSLFAASLSPSYSSMCQVVLREPSLLNDFRIVMPNVSCGGSGCSPSYSGKYFEGTNIYDLGWINDDKPFCLVDVCNPDAAPLCNFPVRPPRTSQVSKGEFAGLQGFIRRYRMSSTAVSATFGGADVQITRDFDNILLPLFQFGVFTDSDFELYDPPNWAFGGWVHTNGDFYLTADTSSNPNRAVFSRFVLDASNNLVQIPAQITVSRHVVIGRSKPGNTTANSRMRVYSSATTYDDVAAGSALNGANVANCQGIVAGNPESPAGTCGTFAGTSAGTVKIGVPRLRLPIQAALNANPIALIQRGVVGDPQAVIDARYYYKAGIRISLADYQNQLPRTMRLGDSPDNPTGPYGGIQLDAPDPWLAQNVSAGASDASPANIITTNCGGGPCWYYQRDDRPNRLIPGQLTNSPLTGRLVPLPRGYQPKIKTTNGRPTGARVNGNRIHGWLKVELVKTDSSGRISQTFDITEEIANLGLTVPYIANGYYYPRVSVGFPAQIPISTGSAGPYPDENSVLHLQRFAVPYTNAVLSGVTNILPADLNTAGSTLKPVLDNVNSTGLFDYYASMALRALNNSSLTMYGIKDELEVPSSPPPNFLGWMTPKVGTANPYAEPQADPGGFYTQAPASEQPSTILGNPVTLPQAALTPHQIDFRCQNSVNASRTGSNFLSENINLPKNRASTNLQAGNAVFADLPLPGHIGESTWFINNQPLIPFPINMYDAREGTPHEYNSWNSYSTSDPPVSGLSRTSANKNGVINLVEIDMGNLGRLLRGDFDTLFAQMGNTAYRQATGNSLRAADIRDNIDIRQDNGWIVYISDRRGDDPVLQNKYTATGSGVPAGVASSITPGTASHIGNGEYHREDVVWNPGGNITTGGSAFIPSPGSCTVDGSDKGKSPQDANNNCVIERETAGNFSETAPYNAYFNADQSTGGSWSDNTPGSGQLRHGNMVAMTQVPTTTRPSWSVRPPVSASGNNIELFRRAVRLVNAANLFPTGPVFRTTGCNTVLGVTITTENPVYVFGNYNAPAGQGVDTDQYPGIQGSPGSLPTPTTRYNGNNLSSCGNNCHVPSAIVADAVTLLSGPCVGTANTSWGTGTGAAGWLDSRSFVMPYQAIGYRPARSTTYRFAMVAGFTPSWYDGYWGNPNVHQGGNSQRSSGALNNFPRFLEDWGQNGASTQHTIYAGSLIRMYKSRQGNGAFKRNSASNSLPSHVDYVYRPPNRDWFFDLDFNSPCLLPPGSPFLQLVDFKGFQQGYLQRQ